MSESSEMPSRPRRKRGIYLLPNLFTTGTLFAGFYSIIASSQDRFAVAAIAIFVAMLTDMLDGRVARLTNAESDFGIQYDSLADLVAFGLASGLLAYNYSLHSLAGLSDTLGKLGWLAAFFYTASAALRLARFNITRGGAVEKKIFLGLPSPAAAGVLVGFIWVGADFGIAGYELVIPVLLLTIGAGALMVSNVRYNSFKDFNIGGRVPFRYILMMVVAFVLIVIDPPRVLFIGFLVYALSGPVMALKRHRRRAARER
ncbi:phosphatidylcholine/phosphatidylserine synthase [Salinisphaera sp. Q1T1-3]|uniref:CDP-alcohol phosphatidyltransferase family protein n=1 Tax=Salinisphaera sp. Q1T1-3 TaxID=2321229 RepID=UPI000E711D84|nr:phosphatidylcholine/phosphatidylserine synthase [Salinisphaera sp. Q1T1-3]RJS93759.1 phosphatidylcholine/phosphatidylserine synthase [Salinisphaera sp. Q1T1-3]